MEIYIYFELAKYGPDADTAYCYVIPQGLTIGGSAATLGSASSPVIVSSLGTTAQNTGVEPFNSNVYEWYTPSCMTAF